MFCNLIFWTLSYNWISCILSILTSSSSVAITFQDLILGSFLNTLVIPVWGALKTIWEFDWDGGT